MRATHLLCAIALLLASAPAHAVNVRLELAPMLSIPLGPLLDGIPVVINPPQAAGGANVSGILVDVENSVGGGMALSLMLNDFEIRYEFASIDYSELVGTHYEDANLPGFLLEIGGAARVDVSDSLDSVFLHNVVFGYRFTPFDWKLRPYVPFGVGFAVAQLRNDMDTIFGFTIQGGIGLEYILGKFRLGAELRYSFHAYKNPDTSINAIQGQGNLAVQTNSDLFETVMETLSMLNINIHASYSF